MNLRSGIIAGALASAILVPAWAPASAQSSNTATSRAFTTEWECENGRTVLINSHPRRPREVAHVTYLGNRVAVKPKGPASDGRHVSDDGKVSWQWRGDEALLSYQELLQEPIICKRKSAQTTTKK